MGCSLLAILGYAMLYTTNPATLPGVGYAGCSFDYVRGFPDGSLMLVWGSGNAGSSLKKGVIIGLQSGVGILEGNSCLLKL